MSDINKNYLSDNVQRTLTVIKAMAGKEVSGIAPTELAALVQATPSNVTRILANLEAQQFVERLPSDNNRWRLAVAFVQIANTVTINFTQSLQQIQQDQRNYANIN